MPWLHCCTGSFFATDCTDFLLASDVASDATVRLTIINKTNMLSSKTLLCIGAFLPGLVYAQQKNVFIEDSAYYVSRNGFMIGLRDSLPDGYWNLFNSKKGDFNNKNIQEHILETGFFNNGVRDGKFTYYKKRFRNRDSEAKSYISGIYFYENGMLHG